MVVEEIYLRVHKGAPVPLEDGDDKAGGNDPEVDDLIELSVMGDVNRDVYVTTEGTVFPALVL